MSSTAGGAAGIHLCSPSPVYLSLATSPHWECCMWGVYPSAQGNHPGHRSEKKEAARELQGDGGTHLLVTLALAGKLKAIRHAQNLGRLSYMAFASAKAAAALSRARAISALCAWRSAVRCTSWAILACCSQRMLAQSCAVSWTSRSRSLAAASSCRARRRSSGSVPQSSGSAGCQLVGHNCIISAFVPVGPSGHRAASDAAGSAAPAAGAALGPVACEAAGLGDAPASARL